jgi:hypothetical protein
MSYREAQSQEVKQIEGKKQYRDEVSNRFAALEDLDAEMDINSAWETIRAYQNFSQGESRLLQTAKLQWFQESREINGVYLNN